MNSEPSTRIPFRETGSVCPVCLRRIPARLVRLGDEVRLEKDCPNHGFFEAVIWKGLPDIRSWSRPKTPFSGGFRIEPEGSGCPYDCGLCPSHNQRTCTALVEITQRCNLGCPICFASSGADPQADPSLETLRGQFRAVMHRTGGCNIQISGGEPTVRNDLPAIISIAREEGYTFVQLNTNGIRIAEDKAYAKILADAGLASAFLQFDGLEKESLTAIRGRDLREVKVRAVQHLAEAGIGIVLVPTVVRGVNDHELGAILKFAVDNAPAVRGVHFQPMSYFGRYPVHPAPDARVTLPEIMSGVAEQSGLVCPEDFVPPGCEHSLCSFNARYLVTEEGTLQRLGAPQSCCGTDSGASRPSASPLSPAPAPVPAEEGALKSISATAKHWSGPEKYSTGSGMDDDFQRFLNRAKTYIFTVSGMAFQDAWTLDFERLRGCCIHVSTADGRLIPFCAYNLTSASGRSIHRGGMI